MYSNISFNMRSLASSALVISSLLFGISPAQADYVIPSGTASGDGPSDLTSSNSSDGRTLNADLNCEDNVYYGITNNAAANGFCIREVIKHQKNIGKAITTTAAMNTAMSTLPTSSPDSKYTCGLGTGGNSGTFAVSTGCSSNLSDRLSFNAGASIALEESQDSGSGTIDNYGIKAGFLYKFGPMKKSTLISLKEKKELKQKL